MWKPDIGDIVRYTIVHDNGTVEVTIGKIDHFAYGFGYDSERNVLYVADSPEDTDVLERAFPDAQVVFFHEAYDGDVLVQDQYAIRDPLTGNYTTAMGGYIYRDVDKVVSFDVVVP